MFSVRRFLWAFQGALPAHYIAYAYMCVPLCVSACVCVCASRIYLLFSSNSLSHVLVGVPISRFQCLRIGGLFGASLFMLPPSSCVGVCECVRHSQLAQYLHICSVFMILLISEHTQLFMLSHIMYTTCGAKCKYFALFFSVAMLG